DAAMQSETDPDGSIPQAYPAKENTGQNCSESFRRRFPEMNHTVRHRHNENRIKSERFFKRMY
ncbi:hypothetical protein OFB72_28430, partial [Escherichia coli]|nr:hypothetical protein [Escherichia coli]